MKPSSIPKKILLAFFMLGTINFSLAQAQTAKPIAADQHSYEGMIPLANNTMPANYKSFEMPKLSRDKEIIERNKGYEQHPELGLLFADAPEADCFEDLAKRTEKTKTFIKKGTNGTGLFIQSSTDPMHMKNANGEWITINALLAPSSTNGVYAATQQVAPVVIDANNNGQVTIGKEGYSLTFNNHLELVYITTDGLEQSLGNADWTRHTAGSNGVYVTDAWPGIDIEINTSRGAAKTNFIVNQALPQYSAGKLVIRDHLQMTDGFTLFSGNKELFKGQLQVKNKAGENMFVISEAVAYEKAKVRETFTQLDYKVKGNTLDILVTGDLLDRPASSYPLVIDPFVQSSNSVNTVGSTYSAAWTQFCTINNLVPVPSGMTITNVAFTFSYQATGNAIMTNARYDFLYNACKSPTALNSWWSCWTAPFQGTCQGVNQTIWNDVSACALPAQCSYNQDVPMRFYRNINAGICDNVGIIAATPYTITISGNTLDPGPVTASVGTVNPVCAGTSVTLNASGNYGAQPLNYTWFPGNLPGQSVVVNPTTTTTYTVNITDACGNLVTGTVTVNIIPAPAPPAVVSPVNLCQFAPAPNMSTYVTGTNVQWYNTQTGGAPLPGAPTIDMTTVNSNTYWVSQTINGCESQRAQIIVNVNATPPAPTVTTPVNLCQNSSPPPITTYVTSGVNLLWYTTPIGGSPLAGAPNISTLNAGNTAYYVSQTVNGCESPRASILIIVSAQPPMPNAPSPINYCQYTVATPLVATGIQLKWYDVPTGGVPLPSAPTPNTAIVGTVTFYVSQTINGCESQRRAVVVNITEKPQPPAVVTPVTYCQGETPQPLSNSVTGSNIKWYLAQTGGTPIPMPVVNTSVISNNTYWVSQTVNNCESDRVSINVIVATQPGAPTVVSPVVMCQFSTPTPLSPNVTGTGLKWYTVAVGGTGSSTEPVINTATTGNTTYWVSQSVGSCEGPRTPITVTINPKPNPPTVTTPVTYCQFATATALTANGQNLTWYDVATGGSPLPGAPVPPTTATGTQDFYVSQTVNGCESDRAHIVVNVNPTPAAPVVTGSPVTYCQYEIAQPILDHVTPTTGLRWYTVPVGGTGSTVAPTINTSVVSTTTYYISQVVGGCESERTPLQIIIGTSPQPPTVVTPLVYCQNDVIPPLTNSVTGFNLMWYSTGTGGTGSATAPVVDPSIPGTTYYYVSQGLGNCESLRDTLEVIIHPTPALPTVVSPTEVCQFTTHQLTAQGQNLLWYTTATGGTGVSSMNANTTTAGNTTYYVSQTINGCEGPREAIIITVKPQPAPPAAQTNYTYCQFDTAVTVLTTSATNPLWYDQNNVQLPGAPTPSTQVAGTFHFFVTETVNACESEKTDITVLVHPKPGLPTVEQITICQGDATPVLNAVGQNLLWYHSATGGTGSPTAPIPTTADTGVQEYYVSQTINGCEGDRALIRVTVNPKVEASIAVSNDKACTGELVTITFTGNGPGTSTYNWDFDGANDVTGTGAGPYIASWDSEGDKTVTVTITNLNCSATASINVNVQSRPKAHFDIQKDICQDEIARVQVDYDLMDYPQFVWNFFDAEVLDGSGYGPYSIKWNSTGLHYISLQLTGINCPSELFFDTISVHKPVAKVMHLSTNDICTADSVLFTAQAGLDYKYEWLPAVYFGDNNGSLSAWGVVQKAGYITLNVTDRWGCVSSDSLMLEPKNCCEVFLPNTFTPNGDGKNDVFRMVTQGNQELSSFIIVDRWGKRVFETINQYEAWDGSYNGEAQDMGTYHYYLRYRCAGTKEIMEMKGDVILLR
jgi:gliding motility-associated-like protein